MYPILLDVTDRRIVIIGGGAVAARKAKGLLQAGATDILAVAPEYAAEFPSAIRRRIGTYSPIDLDGASLVFAATDSAEVNSAVVRDARKRNLWVNRADFDEEAGGDFTVAASFREGAAIVAVATESPALSAMIRSHLHTAWDPRWSNMATAMQKLRPVIRQAGIAAERRREIMKEMATDAALDKLASGGENGLMDWLAAKYPELSRS